MPAGAPRIGHRDAAGATSRAALQNAGVIALLPLPRPARQLQRLARAAGAALALALTVATRPAFAVPAQATTPAAAASGPTVIRLMAFNDFHGHLEAGEQTLVRPHPADPRRTLSVAAGGAAALAGLVQALRAPVPHSLLLSTGDLFGATPLVSALFHHEATVAVMNQVGLELGTLGNHEFDAGTPELLRLLNGGCHAAADAPPGPPGAERCAFGPHPGARFELLAANVHRLAGGGTLLAPHALREFGPVKLGIVGVVTRSTPWIVRPSAVAGLRFEHEADAVLRSAAALRAQGAQAVVALVHEGGEIGAPGAPRPDWNDPDCPAARGEIFALARRLAPAVDVIFSAHTHQGYLCRVAGRPVLQAVSAGRGLSVVDLAVAADGRVSVQASRNLPVFHDGSEPRARQAWIDAEPAPWAEVLRQARPVAAVAERVAAQAQRAAPLAGRPVGRIGGPFERRGRPDSPAGRGVADAQWAATRAAAQGGAELALTNPGGLRADLACRGEPPCPVSQAQAFALQPFGNSLVVMSLSGRELKALLESQQRPGQAAPHFLIPSSSLRYRWLSQAPAGRRVADLRLQGRRVADTQRVRLVVNSYLAEGGDGFALLRAGRERQGGPQDLDALLAWLASGPSPDPVPRITLQAGASSDR